MSEARRKRRESKSALYGDVRKTRSKRCGPCPFKGSGSPAGRSCKVERLCDRYDLTLRDLFPGESDDHYESLAQEIEIGHVHARGKAKKVRVWDGDETAFLDFVRMVHDEIFGVAYGDLAGRFRREGEHVYVGHMHHEFEGAPHDQIETKLGALRRSLGKAPPSDAEGFAYWAARLLQGFLAIHPFQDGNGRTARFLVEHAANSTDTLMFMYQPGGIDPRRGRADYLYALQYAHKHEGVSLAAHGAVEAVSGVGERDSFRPLARWVAERVLDLSDLDFREEPPEWLEEDSAPFGDFVDEDFVDDGEDGSDRRF